MSYSVRYGVVGSAEGDRSVEMAPGGESRQTTISGLQVLTTYSIQVAAVNSAGIGMYSNVIMSRTQPSKCMSVKYPQFLCN